MRTVTLKVVCLLIALLYVGDLSAARKEAATKLGPKPAPAPITIIKDIPKADIKVPPTALESCSEPADTGKLVGDEVCEAKISKWQKCNEKNKNLVLGKMLCDPTSFKWVECNTNQKKIYESFVCEFAKWVLCDNKAFNKVIELDPVNKYTCDGTGKWLTKDEVAKIKQTSPSIFKVAATDNKWVHYGDNAGVDCTPHTPVLPELNIDIPYTIGDKMELMVEVKGVTNDDDYPTEIEIDNNKDWPVDGIWQNLGKPMEPAEPSIIPFVDGGFESSELDGFVLQAFNKDEGTGKKLKNNGIGNHTIKFDVGKESFSCGMSGGAVINYDDFDIKNFFIKTGVVSDERIKFGDVGKPDTVQNVTFSFPSTIAPNLKDDVQVRLYHKGLAPSYNNKLIVNGSEYLLKDFLPVGYKEFAPNDWCDILWPKDLDYVDVIIKASDIKKGDNSFKIEAMASGNNYDDFIVDRIEVLINEYTEDNYKQTYNGYDVKDATNSWSRCAKFRKM